MRESKRSSLGVLAGILAMVLGESDAEAENALSLLRRKARQDGVTGGEIRAAFEAAACSAAGDCGLSLIREMRVAVLERDTRIARLIKENSDLEGRISDLDQAIEHLTTKVHRNAVDENMTVHRRVWQVRREQGGPFTINFVA